MLRKEFPSCCTAGILIGMGRSSVGDGASQLHSPTGLDSDLEVAQELKRKMCAERDHHHALLTAVVNSHQKQVLRVALKMGWKASKWMSKEQHSDTKVKIIYWAVMDGIPSDQDLYRLFPVKPGK